MTENAPLMKIRAVSEMTGVAVGTLYHWVGAKKIPFVRLSARCVRFRRGDIEKWIANKVVDAALRVGGKEESAVLIESDHERGGLSRNLAKQRRVVGSRAVQLRALDATEAVSE